MWGRVRRSVESASATHEATEEDLHDAQLSLAAEVARDYVTLRGTQQQLDIAKADVAAAEDLLKLTENRAAGGIATQLEVSSQKARVSDARSRVPSLEQGVQQLKDALALLLASQPGALDQELASPQALPSLPASVAVGVPAELARRRPDVRRAEARLHVATAEIGIAVADLYPRITLSGSFVTESLNVSDLTAWGSRQWSIGPRLYLPLFNGARLHSVIELRKLEQQEAAVNYQQTVLKSWHEVENSLASYSAELKRHQELTDMVAASRDAYDIAKIRYEHGQTNYLVPLDAQRTLLQAERALSDNETQARTQLIGLYKALGGSLPTCIDRRHR
jgi:NodT family efflux transporter outer membrane factor (OMF) lipoprotein